MLSNQENFKNNSSVGFNKKDYIEGLGSFKKHLEKYFFSQVVVRDVSTESTSTKLVLELSCNFGLTEMLHHLNLGTWGNFGSKENSFRHLLETLRGRNDQYLEVEEFAIFLKDTSIIINKIYDESIPQQLEEILQAVSKNYVHFTRGLTEIPYEIYIPVFEESLLEDDNTLMNIKSGNTQVKDYFKYWGLYFYTEDDALIYDLKNTAIISGDLQMLNG
jgi:hypothetical protein